MLVFLALFNEHGLINVMRLWIIQGKRCPVKVSSNTTWRSDNRPLEPIWCTICLMQHQPKKKLCFLLIKPDKVTVQHTLPHLTTAKVVSNHPAKNKNRSRVFFFCCCWASFGTMTIMLSPNLVMNSHDLHLCYTVLKTLVCCGYKSVCCHNKSICCYEKSVCCYESPSAATLDQSSVPIPWRESTCF